MMEMPYESFADAAFVIPAGYIVGMYISIEKPD